ncbi:unnamed protein product, partial [Protopolystoma xenopodis]
YDYVDYNDKDDDDDDNDNDDDDGGGDDDYYNSGGGSGDNAYDDDDGDAAAAADSEYDDDDTGGLFRMARLCSRRAVATSTSGAESWSTQSNLRVNSACFWRTQLPFPAVSSPHSVRIAPLASSSACRRRGGRSTLLLKASSHTKFSSTPSPVPNPVPASWIQTLSQLRSHLPFFLTRRKLRRSDLSTIGPTGTTGQTDNSLNSPQLSLCCASSALTAFLPLNEHPTTGCQAVQSSLDVCSVVHDIHLYLCWSVVSPLHQPSLLFTTLHFTTLN